MAFNITIVAFGKEPDISDEKLLDYRGFDEALVGKETSGTLHFWKVRTDVPDCQIVHVQTHDEHVHSPNMVLVFENLLPPQQAEGTMIPAEFTERLQSVLAETMIRVGLRDPAQLEGPWQACGVMAFTFLDVDKAVQADLAKGNRAWIRENN